MATQRDVPECPESMNLALAMNDTSSRDSGAGTPNQDENANANGNVDASVKPITENVSRDEGTSEIDVLCDRLKRITRNIPDPEVSVPETERVSTTASDCDSDILSFTKDSGKKIGTNSSRPVSTTSSKTKTRSFEVIKTKGSVTAPCCKCGRNFAPGPLKHHQKLCTSTPNQK